jgi:hypothetical protein
MSVTSQYTSLLRKVANRSQPERVGTTYAFCMGKTASLPEGLLWAAGGALPAYLVGKAVAKDKERQKHKNYALAGAAAGYLGPKLLGALMNPSEALPSVAGFDAQDIANLQLQAIT